MSFPTQRHMSSQTNATTFTAINPCPGSPRQQTPRPDSRNRGDGTLSRASISRTPPTSPISNYFDPETIRMTPSPETEKLQTSFQETLRLITTYTSPHFAASAKIPPAKIISTIKDVLSQTLDPDTVERLLSFQKVPI